MCRYLYPSQIALTQWGDRWLHEDGAPVKFTERASGEEIADVAIQTKQGRVLDARELVLVSMLAHGNEKASVPRPLTLRRGSLFFK